MACSPECGVIYFQRIAESRSGAVEAENKLSGASSYDESILDDEVEEEYEEDEADESEDDFVDCNA